MNLKELIGEEAADEVCELMATSLLSVEEATRLVLLKTILRNSEFTESSLDGDTNATGEHYSSIVHLNGFNLTVDEDGKNFWAVGPGSVTYGSVTVPLSNESVEFRTSGGELIYQVGESTEIINNLTSTDTDKALSAAQGKVLQDTKRNVKTETFVVDLASNADERHWDKFVLLDYKFLSITADSIGKSFWVTPLTDGNYLTNSGTQSIHLNTQELYFVEVTEDPDNAGQPYILVTSSNNTGIHTVADEASRKAMGSNGLDGYPTAFPKQNTFIRQLDDDENLYFYLGGDPSDDASWASVPLGDGLGNYFVNGIIPRAVAPEEMGYIPKDGELVSLDDGTKLAVGDGVKTVTELTAIGGGSSSSGFHRTNPPGMAHFVSVKATDITISANSTTGYSAVRDWEGNVTIGGMGLSISPINHILTVPLTGAWSGPSPKEFFTWSCVSDTDATQSGELLSAGGNTQGITSFSGVGLGSADVVMIANSSLTSFYGAGLDSLSSLLLNDNELESIDMAGSKGGSFSTDVSGNQMSDSALNDFFRSLGDISPASAPIDVSGNPGSATCDTTIATAKGYTVTIV